MNKKNLSSHTYYENLILLRINNSRTLNSDLCFAQVSILYIISHQQPLRVIPVRVAKRRRRLRERPDTRRGDVDIGVWRCGGRDERHLRCGGEP